ncbi:cysteine-rich with EGF-like domain protein 2 isoform X2 [Toxorhynchites rutilus septentrionalis]|uniref:cysteine-rich with EGF-like domain protein 2 isoform X2 n=1 Tax=Toxorhynchites rutilus septentrionalis TaxID=329112 RepID=UPI00247AEB50|nr:cysteine-rich with EGF-like domain protein 2 isoform X2 [Toxorhynchites rutilus septentrionalis]
MWMKRLLVSVFLLIPLIVPQIDADVPHLPSAPASKKERLKSEKLPACKACTVLVNSFNEGLKRTERSKHEGGDAAWEEERLGSYKTSELRLVEIQERLCQDVGRGEDQCHQQAEELESLIEEWWKEGQNTHPDLHQWLCVEQVKVCCPDGHYGQNCDPCPSCFGNGKCKGNGTRKGNGQCVCDEGYSGSNCDSCGSEHYESFRDAEKLLCSKCHKACAAGGCTGAGPNACRVCRSGWVMDNQRGGCTDIDECTTANTCSKQQFCVNNEGSFSCLECDKSCDGCDGDGPDMCRKCADGFELRDGLCTGIDIACSRRTRPESPAGEQWENDDAIGRNENAIGCTRRCTCESPGDKQATNVFDPVVLLPASCLAAVNGVF